jgi:hypothetical protein
MARLTRVLLLLLSSTFPLVANAEEFRGRRYGPDGRFEGTIREDSRGNYRLYDERGRFEGTIRPDGRRYDARGRFEGTLDDETDEDEW